MSEEKVQDAFVTVATFVLPDQMPVAKGLLESRGIKCRVLDELTVQSYNFISNAIGGVKLQVQKTDYERARALLKEGGFIKEDEVPPSKVDVILSDPLKLKQIKIALYSILVLSVVATLSIVVHSNVTAPSTYERFAYGEWSIQAVYHDGIIYLPNTVIRNDPSDSVGTMTFVDPWEPEKIIFYPTGEVKIPGFYSPSFYGKWTISGNTLSLFDVDTLDALFNHQFMMQIESNYMVLIADSSTIHCRDERF